MIRTGGPRSRTVDLSLAAARRIALAAQGFDRPRPAGGVSSRHVARVLRQLGVVQLDFVNVLAPAHSPVRFSRFGPYRRSLLDDLVYRKREITEQWAHDASIVPMDTWPLLRHRMKRYRVRPRGFETFLDQHADYVRWVREQVAARGPLAADALKEPDGKPRCIAAYVRKNDAMAGWLGTVPRVVLETLFGRGELAVAERRPDLARAYDLASRVIPDGHRGGRVDREDAQRALVLRAAQAHGVATVADPADYHRMSPRDVRPRIHDLVERGALREVRVERWRGPAYLHADAAMPRRVPAAALVSPFDPLVWTRDRVERLFGFDYRLEIYVPAPRRRWGYYVLPFLLGDRLVARVDLKADREARGLLVLAAYLEQGSDRDEVAGALARELATLARWLGLDAISVAKRGDLARALATECRGASA